MRPHLRIRRQIVDARHVFRMEGELDGSTACHALDVVARVPRDGRELEIDLSAVRLVEGLGLEILSRGLAQLARQRSVSIVDVGGVWPTGPLAVPALRSTTAGR